MRNILLGLLLCVSVICCYPQPADVSVVYSGNVPQIVVWDVVTVDADGNPLIAGDIVRYEVLYTKAPFNAANAVSVGTVNVSESVIDFSALPRGYYYIGVRSVGTDAEGVVTISGTAWSNDPVSVNPTLRFAYLVKKNLLLAVPQGLRAVVP